MSGSRIDQPRGSQKFIIPEDDAPKFKGSTSDGRGVQPEKDLKRQTPLPDNQEPNTEQTKIPISLRGISLTPSEKLVTYAGQIPADISSAIQTLVSSSELAVWGAVTQQSQSDSQQQGTKFLIVKIPKTPDFALEAEIMSLLGEHENIVIYHGEQSINGEPCMVFERIQGPNCERIIDGMLKRMAS